MAADRPPDVRRRVAPEPPSGAPGPHGPDPLDAEYRLVRGPWPQWMLHIGLAKWAISAAMGVVACIVIFLVVIAVVRAL